MLDKTLKSEMAPRLATVSLSGWDALTFQEYQQRAAKCLEQAHAAIDLTNKALLLEMAQAWIRLAEERKAKGQ
jgi:hypothetical protein